MVSIRGRGGEQTGVPEPAPKERPMRKWLVTFAVAGVGGIGAFLLTDKGRESLRRLLAAFEADPEPWASWNDNAETELKRIQARLNQIAQSLEPRGEPHR